jgi:hypothetical protein
MRMMRFERSALATFLVAGSVTFFAVAVEHAQAQTVNPVPPPPPPVFNPSSPNTVPQSGETPVAPGIPSAPPAPLPPSDLSPPSVATQPQPLSTQTQTQPPSAQTPSQPPAVTSAPVPSKVAKSRASRLSARPHRLSHSRGNDIAAGGIVSGTVIAPYYHSLFGWGLGPYPCGWRREWDGYWVRDCI